MKPWRTQVSSIVLAAGIANALAFVATLFMTIADASGSRVILSRWAIMFGIAMVFIMGFLAVERDR